MSPNNIVRGIHMITQKQMLPIVPKRWQHQFDFGLRAYGLKPFQSAASNGRSVVVNPHTASTKTERLLANLKLAEHLGLVFDGLNLVKPSSFVNVDHSDMHGLTALVGAVQTRKGRAIPCLVEATYASTISAIDSRPRWQKFRLAMVASRRTQSFTGHTIDALQTMADRLGFWPKLVFDRGFSNESIVNHLVAEEATFYIRYLRIIRSPKSRRAKEPWYILTNDFGSSRDKIVKIYYHRFEIEETFKDIKHIFEYKRTRLNAPNSLKVLLWFVSLGIAILYLVTKPTKNSVSNANSQKRTSWLRQAYERLQQAQDLMLWGGA